MPRTAPAPYRHEGHALTAHYQPIVDLDSGVVVGHEALARIETPDGTSSAADAIDASHAADRDLELTAWMLWCACDRYGTGHGGYLAVNTHPDALHADDAAQTLLDVIASARWNPARIVIEVIEADDNRQDLTARTLARLRGAGVRVAIDDYPCGASTLSRVAELAPDIVKIDRSWRHGGAATLAELVGALPAGVTVCVEGIEDDDELAVVTSSGAELAQGYHLGRPAARPASGPTAAAVMLNPMHPRRQPAPR